METQSHQTNDPRIHFVFEAVRGYSKVRAVDVKCAYEVLLQSHSESEKLDLCLDQVYVMTKYMEPQAEDIIALLLFREYMSGKLSQDRFLKKFPDKRGDYLFQYMKDACRDAPPVPKMSKEESVAYFMMMRVCDRMFRQQLNALSDKGMPSTNLITTAYHMAREAHYGCYRQSGVPYLSHPLGVMKILVDFGSESPVLAAALLHDVVEDTSVTLDDIQSRCGVTVRDYVDTVTSVHREYRESHQADSSEYDKAELDERSFQKLVGTIRANRSMIFALHIKAADRLHNLQTIESMPCNKIFCKDDETQLDYLPLLEQFKLGYFVSKIKDLVWRSRDFDRYERFENLYQTQLRCNRSYVETFKKLLRDNCALGVNEYAGTDATAGYEVEIHERDLLPSEVFECIKESGTVGSRLEEYRLAHRLICKRIVPTCDMDIIYTPRDCLATQNTFILGFIKMFEKRMADTGCVITDFSLQSDGRYIIKVEDSAHNSFRCCLMSRTVYTEHRAGIDLVPQSELPKEGEAPECEMIQIRLRNGNPLSLPRGASAIDVAYAIHADIGHAAKSARINGKEVDVIHTVYDGDHVEIVADTNRSKDKKQLFFIRHVRLDWLNHVKTKKARKEIMNYLRCLYEGDRSQKMTNAPDQLVREVSERILPYLPF